MIIIIPFNNAGQSQSDSTLTFVTTPRPLIEEKINTTISLFWQIQYESCSQGNNCFRNDLHITETNNYTFDPLIERDKLLFDANTAIERAGTFSYANVRVIMFIDEYVRHDVASISCTATYIHPLQNNSSATDHHTVSIGVTDHDQLPYHPATDTDNVTTSQPATSEPVRSGSSVVLVVCSPVLGLMLLGFFLFC